LNDILLVNESREEGVCLLSMNDYAIIIIIIISIIIIIINISIVMVISSTHR